MHTYMRFQGTVDFMAVEVAGGIFYFDEDEDHDPIEDLRQPQAPEPEPENTQPLLENREDNEAGTEPPAFIHVPIHDVESYWWLAISKMFRKKVHKEGSFTLEGWNYNSQLEQEERLFPKYEIFSARRHVFLTRRREHKQAMKALHEGWGVIKTNLSSIRAKLCDIYKVWEKHLGGREPKLDPHAYGRPPLMLIKNAFGACIEAGRGMKLKDFEAGQQPSVPGKALAPSGRTSSKRGSSSIAPDESVPRKRTR
jgi:hypothetical protein